MKIREKLHRCIPKQSGPLSYIWSVSLIFLASCQNQKSQKISDNQDTTINVLKDCKVTSIDDYPSASGIVSVDSTIYIIGDDANEILIFSNKRMRVPFPGFHPLNKKGRVNKKDKLDFEALLHLSSDSIIWGWGSGSKYPNRYVHMTYDLRTNNVQFNSMTHSYRKLQKDAKIPPKKWNIEGVLSIGNNLILINRETNSLLLYSLADWKTYFKDSSTSIPRLNNIIDLDSLMPSIQGVKSTLSGGEYWKSKNGILLSASVEDDEGIVEDGAILGSFLCFIPLTDSTLQFINPLDFNSSKFMRLGITHQENPVKLEGISINPQDEIFGVVDNDDGSSLLINFSTKEIEIIIK